ncbi:MAG: DAK2 domain-containing protein [Coriobacteriales bacterium]|nr:DAK2 domain-containing protein [Actinomycetes bacterium]
MTQRNLTDNLGAAAVSLISSAADALKERKEEINRLNVFPVPDGDTGTNMSLTMDAVMTDLAALDGDVPLSEVCRAVAHGSLMGARGNSGVILSQILRGLCEVVGAASSVSSQLVVDALKRSVTVAFQAVRKPVEGTMLTVLRDSAEAAAEAAESGASTDAVLDAVVKAAFESVKRTPELLPVLKEHGVVDAGGFGLAVLFEGFVAGLDGHVFSKREIALATGELTVSPVDDWDDQEYLYCTEFLLHDADVDKTVLEDWVSAHGGSELVVGDRETYKIHVHTNSPGEVLSWATSLGHVSEVHINNMRRQTEARTRQLQEETAPSSPVKPVGFVAVAAGDGLAEILTSLGADIVVSGGQTMNPSTAELYEAAQAVHAERVIILPNNHNIIMAAQQVVGLSDKPVAVVPTRSVPEGFAALLAYDPSVDFETAVGLMTNAAGLVRTGEVTIAVRDAKGKIGTIKAGQVIGIADDEIEAVGDNVADVTLELIGLLADGAETLTLLAGLDLDDDAFQEIVRSAEEAYPDLEVEAHRGGQPLYPVILALE